MATKVNPNDVQGVVATRLIVELLQTLVSRGVLESREYGDLLMKVARELPNEEVFAGPEQMLVELAAGQGSLAS